jgi:NitT/TauT family transport system substrate-binding protein
MPEAGRERDVSTLTGVGPFAAKVVRVPHIRGKARMREGRMPNRILMVVVLAVIALIDPRSAPAEPTKFRMGWVVVPADIHPILPRLPAGVTRHLGRSYVIDAVHFDAAPTQVAAFGAGELDISSLPYTAVAAALANAGMRDLRVIAVNFEDGADGYYSSEFMVRKDAGIGTIEDLKGRRIAVPARGGVIDIALRIALRGHGLDEKTDVTVIESAFPNMKALLLESKVDAIGTLVPFANDPLLRQGAATVFTSADVKGKTESVLWVAPDPFLRHNRATVVDFFEDWLRAIAWCNDPANAEALTDMVVQLAKLPRAVVAGWLFTRRDFYHVPNGMPDLQVLQSDFTAMAQLGLLRSKPDINEFVDLTYVQEAADRLSAEGWVQRRATR